MGRSETIKITSSYYKTHYDLLKNVIIHSLEQDGSMTRAEIESVDFDSFIEPFVDEIDFDDDYHIRQVKREIMAVIRAHR